jgi:hypothetical protein
MRLHPKQRRRPIRTKNHARARGEESRDSDLRSKPLMAVKRSETKRMNAAVTPSRVPAQSGESGRELAPGFERSVNRQGPETETSKLGRASRATSHAERAPRLRSLCTTTKLLESGVGFRAGRTSRSRRRSASRSRAETPFARRRRRDICRNKFSRPENTPCPHHDCWSRN